MDTCSQKVNNLKTSILTTILGGLAFHTTEPTSPSRQPGGAGGGGGGRGAPGGGGVDGETPYAHDPGGFIFSHVS